jgi:hypothetical protein
VGETAGCRIDAAPDHPDGARHAFPSLSGYDAPDQLVAIRAEHVSWNAFAPLTMPPSSTVSRQSRILGAVACLLAWIGAAVHAQAQETPLAYAVKATYLYKFAPFVEWPNAAAAFPAGAFTVCIVGDGPIENVLLRAVAGQQISGHPITVRRFAAVTRDPGCSMLYAAGTASEVAADLAALHGAPVLTVTDGASDPAATGIINFIMVDGHVRFDIDASQASADGLTVSSKLLSLAVHVVGRSR